VSTSSSTPGGSYPISVNATDAKKLAPSNGPQALTLTAAAVIAYSTQSDHRFHAIVNTPRVSAAEAADRRLLFTMRSATSLFLR